MTYFWVFVSAFLADVSWTMYFKEVGRKRPTRAAFWAVAIILMGAFVITEYIKNPLMLIAYCAGSFCGVYVTVRYTKEK